MDVRECEFYLNKATIFKVILRSSVSWRLPALTARHLKVKNKQRKYSEPRSVFLHLASMLEVRVLKPSLSIFGTRSRISLAVFLPASRVHTVLSFQVVTLTGVTHPRAPCWSTEARKLVAHHEDHSPASLKRSHKPGCVQQAPWSGREFLRIGSQRHTKYTLSPSANADYLLEYDFSETAT